MLDKPQNITYFSGGGEMRKTSVKPSIVWEESPVSLPFVLPIDEEPKLPDTPSWRDSQYLSDPTCDFVPLVKQHQVLTTQIKQAESKLKDVRGGIRMHLELAGAERGLKKSQLDKEHRITYTVAGVAVSLVKSIRHPLNTEKLKQLLMVAGLDADVVARCFEKATGEAVSFYPEIRYIKSLQEQEEQQESISAA